jgi:hypothetical protein
VFPTNTFAVSAIFSIPSARSLMRFLSAGAGYHSPRRGGG